MLALVGFEVLTTKQTAPFTKIVKSAAPDYQNDSLCLDWRT